MYCLMSALSMNARSIAPVMLEVQKMRTFGRLRRESICVSIALTTRRASEGSLPDTKADLAAARLST